jgi:EmrB/QacA subfamily drug resistance transporter
MVRGAHDRYTYPLVSQVRFFEALMVGFTRPPCDAAVIRATPIFPAALSQKRKRLTLAATILGSSMAFVDGSVVNIALPAIQQALHTDAVSTQWIVNAYLLLLGALVLVGGSAADLYGRRRIFLLGILTFTTASIACGLSPDITVLVVSRAVQGLGAALLTPSSLAMLGATFDEHERSHAIGIWAGVGALTSAIGPVLGGWLVDQVSWRAIFLLNVPLAVAAAALAAGFACESRDPQAKRLDWNGAVTVAIGLTAITWGLGAIPASGFHDMTVLGALGLGAMFLILFVAIEARSREGAMMPLSLYRSRNFSGTNMLTLLLYFALGGALYYLPFGLIRLGGYSATQAGAALLPFALIMGFGASFAGTLSDRFGPRLSLTAGPIIAACGLALLAFADFSESYWGGVFPAICALAVGMTITVPPLTSTVMASVGEARAGIASGVNNAVARVAGLLAVAALGTVLFASFSHHLAGLPPARANDALNAVLAGRASVTDSARAAFDHALRTVMLVTALCAMLGGVVGWQSLRPIGSEATR